IHTHNANSDSVNTHHDHMRLGAGFNSCSYFASSARTLSGIFSVRNAPMYHSSIGSSSKIAMSSSSSSPQNLTVTSWSIAYIGGLHQKNLSVSRGPLLLSVLN